MEGFSVNRHVNIILHEKEESSCEFILTCQSNPIDPFNLCDNYTNECFNPLTKTCSCYFFTHTTLELKNRVEEPVQVQTPFIIEHHSSVYID